MDGLSPYRGAKRRSWGILARNWGILGAVLGICLGLGPGGNFYLLRGQDVPADSIRLQASPAPIAAVLKTPQITGTPGNTTKCYWLATEYASGETDLSGPQCVKPPTLSSTAFVSLSWNSAPGATGYTVLKTSTSTKPTSGSISFGSTARTVLLDTGQSLSSWTAPTCYPAREFRIDFNAGTLELPAPSASPVCAAVSVQGGGGNLNVTNLTVTGACVGCATGGNATPWNHIANPTGTPADLTLAMGDRATTFDWTGSVSGSPGHAHRFRILDTNGTETFGVDPVTSASSASTFTATTLNAGTLTTTGFRHCGVTSGCGMGSPVVTVASPATVDPGGHLVTWGNGDGTPAVSATAPIVINPATGNVTCNVASGSVPGCLPAADWTAFNAKQSALTFTAPLVNTAGTVAWSASAHHVASPQVCAAASASGTAYTCSTSPTFTPAAGDQIIFKADVANTGAATLNANSTAAKSIKKQGGGTALVANDLLSGQDVLLIYDGTNWQMQGQLGNPSGGLAGSGIFGFIPLFTPDGSTLGDSRIDYNLTVANVHSFLDGIYVRDLGHTHNPVAQIYTEHQTGGLWVTGNYNHNSAVPTASNIDVWIGSPDASANGLYCYAIGYGPGSGGVPAFSTTYASSGYCAKTIDNAQYGKMALQGFVRNVTTDTAPTLAYAFQTNTDFLPYGHLTQAAANGDKAGVLTCAIGTVTKTFSTAYSSTPVIVISDETTVGGANVSTKSASAFTVTCTGLTDVVDYFVIGNPN